MVSVCTDWEHSKFLLSWMTVLASCWVFGIQNQNLELCSKNRMSHELIFFPFFFFFYYFNQWMVNM